MAEQGVEMIHAICEREQCKYDGMVDNTPKRAPVSLVILVGGGLLGVALIVTIIIPFIGIFLVLCVIGGGILFMLEKSINCPACIKGNMHDISGDRGAALYARKYPSGMGE